MTCSPFMADRQTYGRGLVPRRDGVRSEDQGRSPSTARRLVLGNWLWPASVALRRRACLFMRNGKGEEVLFSWRDLRRFVGSYARPELPRRNCPGVTPIWRLKCWESWLWSEKPACAATSASEKSLPGCK